MGRIFEHIRAALSAMMSVLRGPQLIPPQEFRLSQLRRAVEQRAGKDETCWQGCLIGLCTFGDQKAAEEIRKTIKTGRGSSLSNASADFSKDILRIYLAWPVSRHQHHAGRDAIRIDMVDPNELSDGDYVVAVERESDVDPSWFELPAFKIL